MQFTLFFLVEAFAKYEHLRSIVSLISNHLEGINDSLKVHNDWGIDHSETDLNLANTQTKAHLDNHSGTTVDILETQRSTFKNIAKTDKSLMIRVHFTASSFNYWFMSTDINFIAEQLTLLDNEIFKVIKVR